MSRLPRLRPGTGGRRAFGLGDGRLPAAASLLSSALAVVVAGTVLAACGTSLNDLVGSTSTTAPTSSTTTSSTAPGPGGEVAVAFPVATCTTSSGAALPASGWRPSVLLAPIPTALVGAVEFYSDGLHTVLGPTGWSCSETQPSANAVGLVVYPPGGNIPAVNGPPAPGTQGIFATFATTGHQSGISLVCPFFTLPSWQRREANCTQTVPQGEQTSLPTPDVTTVLDPSGVIGNLPGSGGNQAVTGAVLFPQAVPAVTNGTSLPVAEESCALTDSTLCRTVLSDFEVRELPVPNQSSSYPSYGSSGSYGSNSPGGSYSPGGSGTTSGVAAPASTAPIP